MGILEQITQMKSQGRQDSEIIRCLQEQGVAPKDIQDAMSQAQIKNAVSGNSPEGMQSSIINQQQNYEYQNFAPQEAQAPEYYPQQAENYQPIPQETYSQDYYPQQTENYGYSAGATDTSSLIEISEQVFSDKIKKVQSTLDSLNEFKTLADTKLKLIEERLKRIESTIDQLQISILDKIGSYGDNLHSIKKEMSMMQDSFGKAINPLLDKYRR